jgi:hypothetical protein
MPELDVSAAISFLDRLDPGGRHTIASEHPTNGPNGIPKWEGGATFEAHQREWLIADIKKRQARGSNVYYGVNRPCPAGEQKGFNGKCNVNDIVAIRALAFDIDLCQDLALIETGLSSALRPSLIINTGGGFHLIYLLSETINVNLYRAPPITDEQKKINDILDAARKAITSVADAFETMLRFRFRNLKIDGMSNVDRVMRLPGTVNYPKAEKRAKGQVEALAHIAADYGRRFTFPELRHLVPGTVIAPPVIKKPYVPPEGAYWIPYKKALACCQFLCDKGAADSNDWYTRWVMLPLIGAIHDEDEHSRLTLEEAYECFILAISGGPRYGVMGRGPGYFTRQWRSHHPERPNYHRMGLGSLIHICKELGMKGADTFTWRENEMRQLKELQEPKQVAPQDQDIVDELRKKYDDK